MATLRQLARPELKGPVYISARVPDFVERLRGRPIAAAHLPEHYSMCPSHPEGTRRRAVLFSNGSQSEKLEAAPEVVSLQGA